ncbi:Hypothetical predicted protein [Prunus dulcis]|uniref:Uncharacterized protein n=1 Tax=Prunus dulcis TaxID=3755 RepID=A0A5E4FTP1_PRUDU|nr:hypothetical protein L3X38_025850 [Prunus dulcis]VVA30881.1 Hypothetical predicted protein [Prunus dulcis]
MEKEYDIMTISNFPLSCCSSMSPEEAREYNNILVDTLNQDEAAFSNDIYDFVPLPDTPRNMVLGPYFEDRMPSSVAKVMRLQQKDICLFKKYLNWQGWDRPKLMRGWPTSGRKNGIDGSIDCQDCAIHNGGRRASMMQSCFVSPVSHATIILS